MDHGDSGARLAPGLVQIEVTTSRGVTWSTGRVNSDQSVFVSWGGPPLHSRQRCVVRVRVWGTDGSESPWSEPVALEAGLFEPSDWSARFISPAWDEDVSSMQPCPMLRGEFGARGDVERARLYVTALGVYEMEINGERVGDQVLAPGWTSYNHRLRYQTFDVTSRLRGGANAIGAILGDGWYRGRIGFGDGRRNIYGKKPALLAQLRSPTRTAARRSSRQMNRGVREVRSSVRINEGEDARLEQTGGRCRATGVRSASRGP